MGDGLPFRQSGRFWRGNLHTHSNESDGALSPAETVRIYQDAGYDFLALTDHFRPEHGYPVTDTRPLRSDGFTTLIGAELHAPRTEAGQSWHIVAVGLPLDFPPPSPEETGPELAWRLNRGHRLTAYAADDAHLQPQDPLPCAAWPVPCRSAWVDQSDLAVSRCRARSGSG